MNKSTGTLQREIFYLEQLPKNTKDRDPEKQQFIKILKANCLYQGYII